MDAEPVNAAAMRALVETGTAEPLLAGFDPVPTWYADGWWHVPPDGEDYVPAGSDLSAKFDALRARLQRVEAFERGTD